DLDRNEDQLSDQPRDSESRGVGRYSPQHARSVRAARAASRQPRTGSIRTRSTPRMTGSSARSDVAVREVPLSRLAKTLVDTDARHVSEITLRLADIERAHLPEPVHPAREDRRRYAERLARFLDDVPGDDQGQDRVMRHLHVDADRLADPLHELVQREILLVADDISLASAGTL